MRIVTRNADVDFPYAWSPDGRTIALNLYSAGQSRIALASVADGSIAPLKTTAWRKAKVGGFSPDGKFLVYSVPATAPADDGGVFTLAVDGSSETKVANGKSPAWTPDGRAAVFVSERSGNSDLWIVPVTGGKPNGTPELLRRNIAANLGFTRDGSLFYGIRSGGKDVLVGKLAADSRHAEQPVILTEAFVGSNGGASWSPDGRHVAFVRGIDRSRMKLMIRTVATGEDREVPTTFDDGLIAQNWGSRWFSDNRSVLTQDRVSGRKVFKKIDFQSGSQEVIFSTPTEGSSPVFDLSPDGRFLFYVQRGEADAAGSRLYRVIRRDLQTGDETELRRAARAELPAFRGLTAAPTGTHLAVRDDAADTLLLLPLAGGSPIELQKGADALEPLAWTHDGTYILGIRSERDRDQLWAVPAAGGARVRLDVSAESINTMSVSRTDGRVLYSVTRPHHELWLVRNLLKSKTTP